MAKSLSITLQKNDISLEDLTEDPIGDNGNFDIGLEVENFIMELDSKLVTLLILRYSGYDYKEIIDSMNLGSTTKYYTLLKRLKKEAGKIYQNIHYN